MDHVLLLDRYLLNHLLVLLAQRLPHTHTYTPHTRIRYIVYHYTLDKIKLTVELVMII